jgi:[ribosomal protein S5]-alanine N-acetyltransferase
MHSMDEYLSAICLNDGDRHIGNIKLGPVRAQHELADVSLSIGDRDCWRKGYASEAITCITRLALADLKLNKVSTSIYSGNQGSCNAFIKAGWRQEAVLRKRYVHDDGPMDIILMGLCRDEFETRT